MLKKELVNNLQAKVSGLTKADASIILDSLGEVITEALQNGDFVTLPGVGKFETRDVGERSVVYVMGEHKGESYIVPAHKAPKFKASLRLKDALK